jgi:hypothetical protein
VFAGASFYPAGIAILASVPLLLVLKLNDAPDGLEWREKVLLGAITTVSILTILSNRFEVAVFMGLAIALQIAVPQTRSDHSSFAWKKVQLGLTFFSLYLVFMLINTPLRQMTLGTFVGSTKVLTVETAEQNSVLFRQFGDTGLSLVALLTLVDNSARNLARFMGDDFVAGAESTNNLRRIVFFVLQVSSWVPLLVVMFLSLFHLISTIRKKTSPRQWGPAVLVIIAFVALPAFARVPPFFWYTASLLFVFILFTEGANGKPPQILRICAYLTLANTVVAVVIANEAKGSLHLAGLTISPTQLSFLTLSSLFLAAFCTTKLFRNQAEI